MATYLDRYQDGEREQVWDELQALGERVREAPLYADALAVAHETMDRARQNLDLLIPRLQCIGYEFTPAWEAAQARVERAWLRETRREPDGEAQETPDDQATGWADEVGKEAADDGLDYEAGARRPLLAPSPGDVSARLVELERRVGLVPLSVRAWYEVVGEANLVGLAPLHWWPKDLQSLVTTHVADAPRAVTLADWLLVNRASMTSRLDPLFLWGIEWAVTESFGETPLPSGQTARTEEVETWGWVIEEIEEPESDPDVVRSAVCMGPDQWVKYGMSGSGWAGVRAPSATMDGEFFNDAYRAPFIDYLRLCFRWGGLPGLRDPATRSAAVEHDLAFLTADLLPL